MAPEIVGEHEGVVQNGEKKIAGFSEKYNPTQDYTVSKPIKGRTENCSMQKHTAVWMCS